MLYLLYPRRQKIEQITCSHPLHGEHPAPSKQILFEDFNVIFRRNLLFVFLRVLLECRYETKYFQEENIMHSPLVSKGSLNYRHVSNTERIQEEYLTLLRFDLELSYSRFLRAGFLHRAFWHGSSG